MQPHATGGTSLAKLRRVALWEGFVVTLRGQERKRVSIPVLSQPPGSACNTFIASKAYFVVGCQLLETLARATEYDRQLPRISDRVGRRPPPPGRLRLKASFFLRNMTATNTWHSQPASRTTITNTGRSLLAVNHKDKTKKHNQITPFGTGKGSNCSDSPLPQTVSLRDILVGSFHFYP